MWLYDMCLLLGDILASLGYHQTLFRTSTRVKVDPGTRIRMGRNSHVTSHSFSTVTQNNIVLGPFFFKQCLNVAKKGSKVTCEKRLVATAVVDNYSLGDGATHIQGRFCPLICSPTCQSSLGTPLEKKVGFTNLLGTPQSVVPGEC